MDRKPLRDFTHNAVNFLTMENSTYKQWVFRYTFLELEKDLALKGDITTNSIFHDLVNVEAKILAKEDGVFAGGEEIKYFLIDADAQFRPNIRGQFKIVFNKKDGDEFKKGDVLLEIEAETHDLLAVERVVLNLLGRMSGIATMTRKIVKMLKDYDVLITPTRKTLWGLIDKKAVVIGGGGTHRLNLGDAILVKGTHLDIFGRDFDALLQKIADSNTNPRFIEIEVESADEALNAAKAFDKFMGSSIRSVGVLLLDNMAPEQIKGSLGEIKDVGLYDNLLFEASGRINENTVTDYAKTGVDIISMGCLTSGIKGVDMSLKMENS